MKDVVLAYAVVFGGILYCELNLRWKLVDKFVNFLHRPLVVIPVLFILLLLMFGGVLHPDNVMFSNDGPMGAMVRNVNAGPGSFYSIWDDSQYLGEPGFAQHNQPFTGAFISLMMAAGGFYDGSPWYHFIVPVLLVVSPVIILIGFCVYYSKNEND